MGEGGGSIDLAHGNEVDSWDNVRAHPPFP